MTYRRLGEIHDAIRARHPDVPARTWEGAPESTRRLALLFLDLAQHHADVRDRDDEPPLEPAALVQAAQSAAVALGYFERLGIDPETEPLTVAFAAALIAEVTA